MKREQKINNGLVWYKYCDRTPDFTTKEITKLGMNHIALHVFAEGKTEVFCHNPAKFFALLCFEFTYFVLTFLLSHDQRNWTKICQTSNSGETYQAPPKPPQINPTPTEIKSSPSLVLRSQCSKISFRIPRIRDINLKMPHSNIMKRNTTINTRRVPHRTIAHAPSKRNIP